MSTINLYITKGTVCLQHKIKKKSSISILNMIYAPPGSGYAQPEEEESLYPDTYEPMMEYPGTMRPGRTPENQPFSSLPISPDKDPEPVPWPHFQEIEWHHNWGAPHEHPIPMEEFIDMHGRWATAEMEAEMRAGARRNVRERREMEESQKAASFILDDDEDDDDDDEEGDTRQNMRGPSAGVDVDLGDGVNVLIGSEIDDTSTSGKDSSGIPGVDVMEENVIDEDDDDSFLLDLGLDNNIGEEEDGSSDEDNDENADDGELEPAFATSEEGDAVTENFLEAMQTLIDAEEINSDDSTAGDGDDGNDSSGVDITFDDLGLSFDGDDDGISMDMGADSVDDETPDDEEDETGPEFSMEYEVEDDDVIGETDQEMVPLDDMIGDEDMGDDDNFDDGGFDYD